MTVGITLLELRDRIRDVAGFARGPAGSPDKDREIDELINTHYQMLLLDHDWPHLRRNFVAIPMKAGQTYYNLPEGCDPERIERVSVEYSGNIYPVQRGLEDENYSQYDNLQKRAERNDPVVAYDLVFAPDRQPPTENVDKCANPLFDPAKCGQTMIEVWPTPATDDLCKMRISGVQFGKRLQADSDKCLLDDTMIILFVAADLLAKVQSPDAENKAAAAASRLDKLKGRHNIGRRSRRMGLGTDIRRTWPTSVVVGARRG